MNTQQELFEGYPFPKTNEQEVLLTLILQGNVSLFDFFWMAGYRTRISDIQIKHFLFLEREVKQKVNKFGNSYNYAIHILPENQKEKAIELYHKLSKASQLCKNYTLSKTFQIV
jgi:hypothetical protein